MEDEVVHPDDARVTQARRSALIARFATPRVLLKETLYESRTALTSSSSVGMMKSEDMASRLAKAICGLLPIMLAAEVTR